MKLHPRFGSPMKTSYATVIVPTHNRPHTLPASIRSIQRQSVQDIEIMIVGDGVDSRTREICKNLSDSDPRINFIDNPKGERSGVMHRHNAVLCARGERIFYNDDDDLLLPNHVEKLGASLERFDFAESLPASVSLSGRIEVSLANHSASPLRHELAKGTLKLTYDTHIGHRRKAYLSLDNPWLSKAGDIAGSFLARFAASSTITWKSIAEVTALSFHGRARVNLADAHRTAELAAFESVRELDVAQFGYCWYLQLLRLRNSSLLDLHSKESTLRNLGFSESVENENNSGILPINFTPEQSQNIAALFKFYQGVPLSAASVGRLMLQLSEPLQGGTPRCRSIAQLAAASVGAEKAANALRSFRITNRHDAELAHYLMFFLLMLDGKPNLAVQTLRRLDGRPCFHESYRNSLTAPA